MITVDGIEYPSHAEYFAKFPHMGKVYSKINGRLLVEACNVPCPDCGLRWHPAAMTMDHLNRDGYKNTTGKRVHPGRMIKYPTSLFKKELAKWEAVCSNCHKIREMERDGIITRKKWSKWANAPRTGALMIVEGLYDKVTQRR